jgi:predicted RNA-binding Zn-ribbon protein involved in translation (DUF1610 family)
MQIAKTGKEARKIKQTHAFKIDLTETNGNGDFFCPRCGTNISPDDCSEQAYSILEPKVNKYGLEEVVIQCNNCYSHIHLTGLSLIQEIAEKMPEDRRKAKTPDYIAHI